MFVGRTQELIAIGNSYKKGIFQFPVIYGRRRVGKTALINHFCKGKKTIYFVAIQSTIKENLEILSTQILSILAPNAPNNAFSSFRAAIDYIFMHSLQEQFIFAIDEYPYLANSDASVSSVLQAAIDKYQNESKLFLILCGSSMSFMERQVLGYESPLYGRRTAQIKLRPFDYYESALMLPGFSHEEKIILYSLTGGIPEYLSRIDNQITIKENVQNLFFDPAGRLFEEPFNLLKQELKMPETYNAIISATAEGRSKLNEIATKVSIETSQCSKMLTTLINLGIVCKEHSITETSSKKTLYRLDDWMFVFWYRFVLPDISRITAGMGNEVCSDVFSSQLNSHVGRAFEECAKQYMWKAQKEKTLPVPFKKIGRWWGSNPALKQEEEIDFIALSNKEAIFGECKWRNAPTGEEVFIDLERKSKYFSFATSMYYYLFSKSGFTDALVHTAKNRGNIRLIYVDNMF